MKFEIVCTNDLDRDIRARGMAEEYLKAGYAVHIDSNCIGHTRAAMVELQGIKFLKSLGAHEVEPGEEVSSLFKPFFSL